MPVYHLIEPKGWIDIKYLFLMKDPKKRQFCQDIYKHLPYDFTLMVSQTNKYLPIFLGLAFLPSVQDLTMVVPYRVIQGAKNYKQCILCLSINS